MLCHFNQFRIEKQQVHYSQHLVGVASRVDQNFERFDAEYSVYADQDGNPIEPKAVALTLAILHDAKADYHPNFAGTDKIVPEQVGRGLAAHLIHRELSGVVGSKAAAAIVDLI